MKFLEEQKSPLKINHLKDSLERNSIKSAKLRFKAKLGIISHLQFTTLNYQNS